MIQWTRLLALVLVIVMIAAATSLALPVILRDINLGLDLRGGVYVLLEAQPRETAPGEEPGEEPVPSWWQRLQRRFDSLFGGGGQNIGDGGISDADINATIEVLRNRVDQFGFAEPIIQREGDRRIRVELAADPTKPTQDQRAILELIGKTALLEFKSPSGETLLTGANLIAARAIFQTNEWGRQEPVVAIEFDGEGARIFADMTRTYQGQVIPIVLDGREISRPRVNQVITGGNAVITGMGSLEEAANTASLLRSGALPLELTQLEVRTVGPLLGMDSLQRSLRAGILGLILVVVFMIGFYRLPGLLASFALAAYIVIVLGVMVAMGAVLTLPGIAGLILTIGMAVDANVIIFERVKEEMYSGKTIRASVVAGFGKALSTILDSNITTLIVAGVLFRFGTGPVRGFALTLAIGVIVSMITALVITRIMIYNLANSNAVKARWLMGVNK
jgi:protein-export SecD/SecF family membrane protein